jgi:hypothetical protein
MKIILEDRWWHRTLKVLFAVSIIFIFLSSLFISSEVLGDRPDFGNVNVINNLSDFTRSNTIYRGNTIPLFLSLEGNLGCKEGNRAEWVSSSQLKKAYCTSDTQQDLDSMADHFYNLGSNKEFSHYLELKESLTEGSTYTDREDNIRVCYFTKAYGDKCNSLDIIKYEYNILYYIKIIIYSILGTFIYALSVYFLYRKIFLYIVFGKQKIE